MKQLQQRSVAELIDSYLEDGFGLDEIMDLFCNSVMVHALGRNHGNVSETARMLKIHRNTAQRFMNKYHVHRKDFRGSDLESENSREVSSASTEGNLESHEIAGVSPTENRSGTRTVKETQPRQERA